MKYYAVYSKITGEILQFSQIIDNNFPAHFVNDTTNVLEVPEPVDNSKYYINNSILTSLPEPPSINHIWNWTTMSWQDTRTEQQKFQQAAQQVLAKRKELLDSTDWIVIKAMDTGTTIPQAWQTYRQELRDITNQTGYPYQVTWPTKPTN